MDGNVLSEFHDLVLHLPQCDHTVYSLLSFAVLHLVAGERGRLRRVHAVGKQGRGVAEVRYEDALAHQRCQRVVQIAALTLCQSWLLAVCYQLFGLALRWLHP